MQTFNAGDWDFHVPEKDGKRSCRIVIAGSENAVSLEVRCPSPVTLNAVMQDGRSLYLDWGSVVSFSAKMVGFVEFEVVTEAPFMYRCSQRTRWFETVDPTRLVVDIDESVEKPISDLIREEVLKYVGRQEAAGVLADDISIAEFLDDIENGDLEFEAEPDPFGLGYGEDPQEPGRTNFKGTFPGQPEPVEDESATPPAAPPAKPPKAPAKGAPAGSKKRKPAEEALEDTEE